MIAFKQNSTCIKFICALEGFKTRCKNLHWAAPKKNIHVYLDEFLDILSDYQDALAEGYMGIVRQMDANDINGIPCDADNALSFINEVIDRTLEFIDSLPNESRWAGIKSETETLIQNEYKYKYLFGLCDNY